MGWRLPVPKQIRTGGGTSIGRDVETGGGDSIGRDRISVEVNDGAEYDYIMAVIHRLRTSIFGDLEAGVKGIVRELESIHEQMAAFSRRLDGMQVKIAGLESKVEDRQEMSKRERMVLYGIAFAVLIILLTQQWPIVWGWLAK